MRIITGRLIFLDSRAAMPACVTVPLEPKPPPQNSLM